MPYRERSFAVFTLFSIFFIFLTRKCLFLHNIYERGFILYSLSLNIFDFLVVEPPVFAPYSEGRVI